MASDLQKKLFIFRVFIVIITGKLPASDSDSFLSEYHANR